MVRPLGKITQNSREPEVLKCQPLNDLFAKTQIDLDFVRRAYRKFGSLILMAVP
jgi:hypothetical protein